jgi:transposase, IS30 family
MASHLTFVERQLLYPLKRKGKSSTEIAKLIGRYRSTVCRELSRNSDQRGYRPQQAQRQADQRRLASRQPHKMNDPNVHQYVQEKLEQYWSPDQIAGRAKRDFRRTSERWLSDQAIYDWIHQQQPEWKSLLRRGGRPRKNWEN